MPTPQVYERMCEERDQYLAHIAALEEAMELLIADFKAHLIEICDEPNRASIVHAESILDQSK